MVSFKTFFSQALLVGIAYWIWGNYRSSYNSLVLPALPAAYFFAGDAPTDCKIIPGPDFCEDAVFWNLPGDKNKLLISCDAGRLNWNTVMGPLNDPAPRGSLWLYDYTRTRAPSRVELEGFPTDADFHPLGIDILPATAHDPAYLFIVNHGRNSTTTEQFRLYSATTTTPSRITYIRTLSHPGFVSPNAIAPISSTSFYISQDHRFTRRIPGIIGKVIPLAESLLALPLSWVDRVGFSDGNVKITRVISHVAFANGVALSKDGRQFVLTSTTGGTVMFYDRTEAGELVWKSTVPVPFNVDNVSFDETDDDNSVIVAGHPHFPSLSNVVDRKSLTAPSWVIRISPRVGQFESLSAANDSAAVYPASLRAPVVASHQVTTIYQSDGSHFSSSTTGLRDGKHVMVTGLYAEGILHCVSK